jgi:mannosylglycerate hydrolase
MQFDVMTRPITPMPILPGEWWVEDPPTTFPMHGWVDVDNGSTDDDKLAGLGVIAEGIYEFAVEKASGGHAIALTLLRAVGYLGARRDLTTIVGGAGPGIRTPEAQLQQSLQYRIALYPHAQSWDQSAIERQAQEFMTPLRSVTVEPHMGHLPATAENLRVEGANVVLSSVKQAEDGHALIVRLYNPAEQTTTATLTLPLPLTAAYITRLDESVLEPVGNQDEQSLYVEIPRKKIMTLRIEFEK